MNQPSINLVETLASIRREAVAAASRGWPGLGALTNSILPDPLDPFALLPVAGGLAAGGSLDPLLRAGAAVILLSTSLRIIDDCADHDNPASLDRSLGAGRAVNIAMALGAVSQREIAEVERLSGGSGGALEHAFRATLDVCHGQEWDMSRSARTLEEYKEIVTRKTVRGYELATALGARVASAEPEVIARTTACGAHLGWMTQILDDIEAMWFPTEERFRENKRTFPLLYGLALSGPEAPRLRELCAKDRAGSAAIRALLDRMDVRGQLVSIALDHRDAALASVGDPLRAEGREILKLWLDWFLSDAARLAAKVDGPGRSKAAPRRGRARA